MMNSEQPKRIRDFIYVDENRLYSFYSQLNKGIAQQIFESYVHRESATTAQANPEFQDEVTESSRSKASQRTESTILYDYMYEQLEDKLRHAIVDVSEILNNKSSEDLQDEDYRHYLDSLKNALMVKVTGKVEIEDYERMDGFIDKANRLMETLALFRSHSDENVELIKQLEKEAQQEKDRNKKAILNEKIRTLKTPKLLAAEMNLLDDPELIKGLRLVFEVFYGKNFEIAITSSVPLYTTFRGIINRDWLRIQPDILRSLYVGVIESTWTMVGQVTTTSVLNINNIDDLNSGLTERLSQSNSLRDPMRVLFNRVRGFEAMLNKSDLRIEHIVCPLAIYRELRVSEID